MSQSSSYEQIPTSVSTSPHATEKRKSDDESSSQKSGKRIKSQSSTSQPISSSTPTSSRVLAKRSWDEYNLNEDLFKSFDWEENKKIRLDSYESRIEALNNRSSFTNLVSSASLILPPEIDTVVITRDQFVVK